MYFTNEEIRRELTEHAEEIRENEDLLSEFADGFTPVYYSEIIKDWQELPPEHEDAWKEYGYDANRNNGGIKQMMQLDLYFYNEHRAREIWEEIEKERKENEI